MNLENRTKWDLRFIKLAREVSTWSKDPKTQVGAVIFDNNNRIVSIGYNGLPRGLSDEGLEDREKKLQSIIHAEINAILFSGRDLVGCSLATYPIMPCSCCSSIIIQAGIKRCISPQTPPGFERWEDSFKLSLKQFQESGVDMTHYDMEILND